jgi:tetratricopeptide (TPR) repeat protein
VTGPQVPDPSAPPVVKVISATDGSVAAERIEHLHLHQPPPAEVSWPVVVGHVPQTASAFQARPELRGQIEELRAAGSGVVLTQVLSGGGGVGKSQLAASYARQAIAAGTDLVVWADAAQPGAIAETFARAARWVRAPGSSGDDAEADSQAFCEWAASTHRSWLVVLDDITDPAGVSQWWPTSLAGTGWVLATTRRRDAVLSGSGRALIEVGVYTPTEARAYLVARLTGAGAARLADHRADELSAELGYLPLALSHAAAYMIDQQLTCADYFALYTTGRQRLEDLMPASADADSYGRPVAITMLLALDAADTCDPAGLARPALFLAGLLDPAGHPAAFWTTSAVIGYFTALANISGHLSVPEPTTPEQTRSAVLLLHRFGLAIVDEQAGPRAIRVHALTARAAREATPAGLSYLAAHAAADGLTEIWPEIDQTGHALAEALRANAAVLLRRAADVLWQPEGHPVVFRAGTSLIDAGLSAAAIAHWQQAAARAEQVLGPEHPNTLAARSGLATSYWQAARTAEAIAIEEQLVADRERILGPDHPETVQARGDLAASYSNAGRFADAMAIEEQVAEDFKRLLGPEHPETLEAQGNLAVSYVQVGRIAEAITIFEQVAADRSRILGSEHPVAIAARGGLAVAYQRGGRTDEALAMFEQVVADRERILGPDHPDTLASRGNLVASYRWAGRTAEAIAIGEQVVADRERVLGPEHPITIAARLGLAASYRQAGRIAEAIAIGEQVAADRERILGPEHPDTLAARASLATSYREAGRTPEAIAIGEQITADMTRILGSEHPDTLAARAELAAATQQAEPTKNEL